MGKLILAVNLAAQASGSFSKLEAVDVLVPFPASSVLLGDHGDGSTSLKASAMEAHSVVVGAERWRGRGWWRRLGGGEEGGYG